MSIVASRRGLQPLIRLVAFGICLLSFTSLTVQRDSWRDPASNPEFRRWAFGVEHWREKGYFRSAGLIARPIPDPPGFSYHLSPSGGRLLTALLTAKVFHGLTGRDSPRLLLLHNRVVTLLAAVMLGLLAFRLARRAGVMPIQALLLAASVEAVQFTFPVNLAEQWQLTGRPWCMLFGCAFLVLEDLSSTRPRWIIAVVQGLATFLMVYSERIAGLTFVASYFLATTALGGRRPGLRRLASVTILPAAIAATLFLAQCLWIQRINPEAPTSGSTFMFRSGLDGSSVYYRDHLDIAFGRDVARQDFQHNRETLFRWPWTFLGGAAAVVLVLVRAASGRISPFTAVSTFSLLGTYVLYAAVFSQAVVIHPYLYDGLLFAPLALALFAVAPATLEQLASQRGIVVTAAVLLALWLVFVQLRHFAIWHPSTPPPAHAGENTVAPGPSQPSTRGQ